MNPEFDANVVKRLEEAADEFRDATKKYIAALDESTTVPKDASRDVRQANKKKLRAFQDWVIVFREYLDRQGRSPQQPAALPRKGRVQQPPRRRPGAVPEQNLGDLVRRNDELRNEIRQQEMVLSEKEVDLLAYSLLLRAVAESRNSDTSFKDALDTSIADVNQRREQVRTAVDEHQGVLQSLVDERGAAQKRATTIETQVNELLKSVNLSPIAFQVFREDDGTYRDALKEQFDNVAQRLQERAAAETEEETDTAKQLEQLRNELNNANNQLANIRNERDQLQEAVAQDNQQVRTFARRLAAIRLVQDDSNTAFFAGDPTQDQIADRVKGIMRELAEAQDALKTTAKYGEELQERLRISNDALETARTAIQNQAETIEANDADIANLKQRLEQAQAAAGDATFAEVDNLRQRIEALENERNDLVRTLLIRAGVDAPDVTNENIADRKAQLTDRVGELRDVARNARKAAAEEEAELGAAQEAVEEAQSALDAAKGLCKTIVEKFDTVEDVEDTLMQMQDCYLKRLDQEPALTRDQYINLVLFELQRMQAFATRSEVRDDDAKFEAALNALYRIFVRTTFGGVYFPGGASAKYQQEYAQYKKEGFPEFGKYYTDAARPGLGERLQDFPDEVKEQSVFVPGRDGDQGSLSSSQLSEAFYALFKAASKPPSGNVNLNNLENFISAALKQEPYGKKKVGRFIVKSNNVNYFTANTLTKDNGTFLTSLLERIKDTEIVTSDQIVELFLTQFGVAQSVTGSKFTSLFELFGTAAINAVDNQARVPVTQGKVSVSLVKPSATQSQLPQSKVIRTFMAHVQDNNVDMVTKMLAAPELKEHFTESVLTEAVAVAQEHNATEVESALKNPLQAIRDVIKLPEVASLFKPNSKPSVTFRQRASGSKALQEEQRRVLKKVDDKLYNPLRGEEEFYTVFLPDSVENFNKFSNVVGSNPRNWVITNALPKSTKELSRRGYLTLLSNNFVISRKETFTKLGGKDKLGKQFHVNVVIGDNPTSNVDIEVTNALSYDNGEVIFFDIVNGSRGKYSAPPRVNEYRAIPAGNAATRAPYKNSQYHLGDTTSEDEDTTSEDKDTTSEDKDTTSKDKDTTSKDKDTTSEDKDMTTDDEDTTTEDQDGARAQPDLLVDDTTSASVDTSVAAPTNLFGDVVQKISQAATDDEAYDVVEEAHAVCEQAQAQGTLSKMTQEQWATEMNTLRNALSSAGFDGIDSVAMEHADFLQDRFS